MRPVQFATISVVVALLCALSAPGGVFAARPASSPGAPGEQPARIRATDTEDSDPGNDNINFDYFLVPDSTTATAVVVGHLDDATDPDDVYAIELRAGETLDCTIVAGAGTQFHVLIYSPDAFDLSDPPIIDFGPAPATREYDVNVSGTHFLDVRASIGAGSGAYELQIQITRASSGIWLYDPAPGLTVPFTSTATVEGQVLGRLGTAQGTAILYSSDDRANWYPRYSRDLDPTGWFYFEVPDIFQKTYFRVIYQGDGTGIPRHNASVEDSYVTCKAGLSGVSARRLGTRRYRLYGTLYPPHLAEHAVRIYRWRYTGGRWRSYGYVKAYCYNGAGNYALALRFPSTGKWRLRAYHGDAGHLPTWTSYSYVQVR